MSFFSSFVLRPVSNSSELKRILALPRRELVSDERLTKNITEFFRRPGSDLSLRWIQAAALYEAARQNGLFGVIGVGHGKTLITLLAPTALESESAVLLVPAQLKKKTLREIDEFYSRHFKIHLERLHIHSYEELSRAKTAELLEERSPDLIVLDEAHKLKRRESARTKRFLRYLRANPSCRLVALSGTMTQRSIMDYAHLAEFALGKNSPLPKGYNELLDWSGALDVDPMEPRAPGALRKLCDSGETVRDGFRRRLVQSPGVIATENEGFEGSIVLSALSLKLPIAVKKLREELGQKWEIGDQVISEAAHLARVMKQLACGFYYRWQWPNNEPDNEWLESRRNWNQELRRFLKKRARAGMDSPLLVSRAIKAGKITGDVAAAWREWERVKDRPEPETVPVWIDDFMVRAARAWAKDGGIVWYTHRAFEHALRTTGFPVYASGDDASTAAEDAIACSIKAQSTGKNLQRYHRNLILSMPSSGSVLEQLIGRTHRPGQKADEIKIDWYEHTDEMTAALENAKRDSEYMFRTTGQRQKLLAAREL